MSERQLISHLVSKISRMDAHSRPFPHFAIDEVLPRDVFTELRSSFPALPIDTEKQGSIYKCRGTASLSNLGRLNGSPIDDNCNEVERLVHSNRVWRTFLNSIRSNEVRSALRRRLLYQLVMIRGLSVLRPWKYFQSDQSTPTSIGKFMLSQSMQFLSMGAGGVVSPHTDASRKLITLLFYFAEEDWKNEWGGNTLFFRLKSQEAEKAWRQTSWSKKNHVPQNNLDEFYHLMEVFSAGDYKANRLVGFCKTDRSYHAVDDVKLGEGKRRNAISINFNITKKL